MHRGERGGALGQLAWDDLKFFLVCAESGSFRRAGKLLRVNSATIVRKIGRLEAVVGMRLFNRSTDGVTLTDDACAVLEQVRAMERAVTGIERQSKVSGIGVRGHVRVAITEGLGVYWVLPRLIDFQRANRRLTFELQATMEITDVGRLEADMSIQFLRPERPRTWSACVSDTCISIRLSPSVTVTYMGYRLPWKMQKNTASSNRSLLFCKKAFMSERSASTASKELSASQRIRARRFSMPSSETPESGSSQPTRLRWAPNWSRWISA